MLCGRFSAIVRKKMRQDGAVNVSVISLEGRGCYAAIYCVGRG